MNLLQNLIMGFVSGFAELLPISAEAHRAILCRLFGVESEGSLFRLLIHIACLAAVIYGCRNEIRHIRRVRRLMKLPARRRKIQPDAQTVYTIRFLRTATILMVVLKLLGMPLDFIGGRMNLLAVSLAVNGVVLILPAMVRTGNKDSRNMLRLDGLAMGVGAGLSGIPGISPVGAGVSLGTARGIERGYALSFVYLLMIRVLGVNILMDLVGLVISGGGISVMGIVMAALGAVCAWCGSMLAMKLMRTIASFANFAGFAYYSWGLALFCFILFLTV